jgi:hypothetical protein
MSKRISPTNGQWLVGLSAVALLIVAIKVSAASHEGGDPVLAACSENNILFPKDLPLGIGQDRIDLWRDRYHGTVSAIVDAHFTPTRIQCTADVRELPSGSLQALAAQLPPWEDHATLVTLSEGDIGAVLLEYLRIYECALQNRALSLAPDIAKDITKDGRWELGKFVTEHPKQEQKIQKELTLARRALHRTLALLGGIDRLRPLSTSLECLQRASLDLRNVLGLAADTTACLPRIWDARGSLRDLYKP